MIGKKKKPFGYAARLMAVALSLTLLVGCVFGCTRASVRESVLGVKTATAAELADVWFAPSTQKIRRDMPKSSYAAFASSDGISVKMGKAESESMQLIITASEEITSYDLEVGDLVKSGEPGTVFSKNNIDLFMTRYIDVAVVRETAPDSTPGEYPDALVPFAAAKKLGENTVSRGENQGLYVMFTTPVDQAAGTYTGTFKLKLNGAEKDIPVSLTVRDYDFAKNRTAKNCFLIDWTSFSYGELDSSQDMYDKYARALLDYRLQPGLLLNDYLKSDPDDIAYYADRAFELAQDERCTVVFLPFDIINNDPTVSTVLHSATYKAYLRAFVDKSLDSYGTNEQCDMIEKTRSYFTFIDEPTMGGAGMIARTEKAMTDYKAARSAVYQEYLTWYNENQSTMETEERAFKKKVIDGIKKVYDVVTGPHAASMNNIGVEVFCPLIDEYDSERNRAEYVSDVERWWYTAVGPRYPYPNYHIDNTSLLSVRLQYWMQAEYDVIGNLFWATNLYNAYSVEEFIEDYYQFPLRYSTGGGANGDGFLFYPGKRYGVDGPVGSVRLHALRDGMEEFEILNAVQDFYGQVDKALGRGVNNAGVNVKFDKVYARMAENLYSGTSVYTTQAYFEAAEDLMGNLAELAAMDGAVADIDFSSNTATVKIVTPKNVTVTFDTAGGGKTYDGNTELTVSGQQTNYKLHVLTQQMLNTGNVLTCRVSDGTKTVSLSINLGGAVTDKTAAQIVDGIKVGMGTTLSKPETSALVAANTVDPNASGTSQWLKLELPATTGRFVQTMTVADSATLSAIGTSTQKLTLEFYNARAAVGGDEGKYAIRILFKYANAANYTEIRSDQLKQGYNTITIGNIFGYDWAKLGSLEEIRIFFGATDAAAIDDIYFVGAKVYGL